MGENELTEVDLTDDEWNLLYQGVLQLGGPSALDDAISRAIGYRDTAELRVHWSALTSDLKARRGLSRRDWRRAGGNRGQLRKRVLRGGERLGGLLSAR